MRTIQMTLDDDLVKAVDIVSKELHTSRSAFAGDMSSIRLLMMNFQFGNDLAQRRKGSIFAAEVFDSACELTQNENHRVRAVNSAAMRIQGKHKKVAVMG